MGQLVFKPLLIQMGQLLLLRRGVECRAAPTVCHRRQPTRHRQGGAQAHPGPDGRAGLDARKRGQPLAEVPAVLEALAGREQRGGRAGRRRGVHDGGGAEYTVV